VADDVDLLCTRGSLEGPVTVVPSTGDSSDLFLRQMLALWKMVGRAGVRIDDDDGFEEDERNEVRRAGKGEKGTAIFLNIEEGESNAAAFERSWEAAPSCFIHDFPEQATSSAFRHG
jgi:hypothetical protein